MKKKLLTLTSMYLLMLSSYSGACTCFAAPLLSPHFINSNIVSAHVIRYIGNEDGVNHAMELQISKVFNGSIDSETIVVRGGDGLSCSSSVEFFPIGSEWVFNLWVSKDGEESGLGGCYGEMEIVEGEIEGHIRDKNCNGEYYSPECSLEKERMSIDQFEIIQDAYFSGGRDAVRACNENNLSECPDYKAAFWNTDNSLYIPYINIRNANGKILGNVKAKLRLHSDDGEAFLTIENVTEAE